LLLTILLVSSFSSDAFADNRYATELREECQSLIDSAVRRPFGWGWDPALRGGDLKRPTSRPVSMEALGTPAAAMVLLWAGDFLEQPKFIDAATSAARGIAAAQMPSGKIPVMPIFTASAGGRDEPAVIPDRASTRAGLALLLMLRDEPNLERDERLDRAAHRAVQWMLAQQTDIGGWPSAYPPDADARDAVRVLRLDGPDYRDSCLAMLLAGSMLDDKQLTRANEKMMAHLLLLRRDDPAQPGNGLWYTAYKPSGAPSPATIDAPGGPDLLASRFAMQTLLGSYLLNGDKSHGMTLDTAALSIPALRRPDKKWDRYPEHREKAVPITGLTNIGTHGLPELLAATTQLRTIGRQRYIDLLGAHFTVKQHIAAALVGLNDNPLTLDLPVSQQEVQPFVDRHAEMFRLLDGPLPETLPERVKRLWALLIRARLERLER
jgi:hypothetical protein